MTQFNVVSLKSVSGEVVAPAGYREVRVIVKSPKPDAVLQESKYLIVPAVSAGLLDAFMNSQEGKESISNLIATIQNGLIRKSLELGALVTESTISFNSVIDACKAENESNGVSVRLSSKSIEAWFDAEGKINVLNGLVALKYPGIGEMGEDQRNQIISSLQAPAANFKKLFVKLSEKGKIAFGNEKELRIFLKVANLILESSHPLESKLIGKLSDCFVPSSDDYGIDV